MSLWRSCGAFLFAATVFVGILASADGSQSAAPAAAPTALVVTGDISTPLSLTPADFKALPRRRVEVEEEGRTWGAIDSDAVSAGSGASPEVGRW